MRVLVIGATGALGRPLVPLLVASGHDVVAASRRPRPDADGAGDVTRVSLDILDANAVRTTVSRHRPDAIVHLATAIPDKINPKRIGHQFAQTNRLRTDGTRNLLAAAAEVGVDRFIAEGLAYAYAPGAALRLESDPLWPTPPVAFQPVVAALRELEQRTLKAGGTVLRFGHLYGPGTVYAPDGYLTNQVRGGKLPLVGDGDATYSFVHVEDAATAVLAALDHSGGGVFNIVDDNATPMWKWLPELATMLGARQPRHIPVSIARLVIGPYGVTFMNELAGASNTRARRDLRWRPHHTSWAEGMASDLRRTGTAAAA
jgi:nucleoside-diphosphate-sugar epimerase